MKLEPGALPQCCDADEYSWQAAKSGKGWSKPAGWYIHVWAEQKANAYDIGPFSFCPFCGAKLDDGSELT